MINWALFFFSFFQKVAWLKNIRFILGFGIIGLLILTIYRAYLMPRSTTTVLVKDGGIYQPVQEKKKTLLSYVHPFAEGYGFAESDGRKGAGAKGGIRIEI